MQLSRGAALVDLGTETGSNQTGTPAATAWRHASCGGQVVVCMQSWSQQASSMAGHPHGHVRHALRSATHRQRACRAPSQPSKQALPHTRLQRRLR